MNEFEYCRKRIDAICARWIRESVQSRNDFESDLKKITTENLLQPKWFDQKRIDEAIGRATSIKNLVGEYTLKHVLLNTQVYNELLQLLDGLSDDESEIGKALVDERIGKSNQEIGEIYALQTKLQDGAIKLFEYLSCRSDNYIVENDEVLFYEQEDIDKINEMLNELLIWHGHIVKMCQSSQERMKKLGYRFGFIG